MSITAPNALSIALQTNASTYDQLAVAYGKVIENFQKQTISAELKNNDLSGDIMSGSVVARRFANCQAADYGTARANGGSKVKAKPVQIDIDDDREFIEEVEEKDILTYGVNGIIPARVANHEGSIKRYYERKFFAEAVDKALIYSPTQAEDTCLERIEAMIKRIEKTSNDFIDGVDRTLIEVVCSVDFYSEVRTALDEKHNANVDTSRGEFLMYHGVVVRSSVYLPTTVAAVSMAKGSVAQPMRVSISPVAKVPQSDATSFGAFVYSGTKVVTEELIYVLYNVAATASPTTATFDKKTSLQADVAVTIANFPVLAVKNSTSTLTATTDYAIAEGVVTIKKEYLATMTDGAVTLTFVTKDGTNPTCVITVSTTA